MSTEMPVRPNKRDTSEAIQKQIYDDLVAIIQETKAQNALKKDVRGFQLKFGKFNASKMSPREIEDIQPAYERLHGKMAKGDKKIEATLNRLKIWREEAINEARTKGEISTLQVLQARHGCLLLMNMEENKEPYGAGALQWPDSKRLEKNDEVAAYIAESRTWILAEVVGSVSNHRYDCIDIDDKEKNVWPFARKQLIPLPKYTVHYNIYPYMAMQRFAKVLAVFPGTTCFYEGMVQDPPKVASGYYNIRFVDSGASDRYSKPVPVSERYVIPYRKEPRMYVRPEKRAQLESLKAAAAVEKVVDEKDVPGPAPKANAPTYYESPEKEIVKKKKVVRAKKVKVLRARVPEHKKKISTRMFGKRRVKRKKAQVSKETTDEKTDEKAEPTEKPETEEKKETHGLEPEKDEEKSSMEEKEKKEEEKTELKKDDSDNESSSESSNDSDSDGKEHLEKGYETEDETED